MVAEGHNKLKNRDASETDSKREPLPHLNVAAFLLTHDAMVAVKDAQRDRIAVRVQWASKLGGIEAAVQEYKDRPTPNALLIEVDTSDIDRVFAALDDFSEYCDPTTKVIVIGASNEVSFYRSLIERGISEYIVHPISGTHVNSALARLYNEELEGGRIIAVCGAKGGVGSSTISHHMAYAMAQLSDVPTLLVDFDIAFGTAALTFDQNPTKGIGELLFASQFDLAGMIERLKFAGGPNLSVVGSSASLYRVFDVTPAMVDSLLQHIRKTYRLAVIDVPHVWSEWVRFALADADDVVLVTTPDIPSFRNAKAILDALIAARPNDAPPRLVLNMDNNPKRKELKAADFRKTLGITPDTVIPYAPQLFSQATNEGRLIFSVEPTAKENKIIFGLAENILTPNSSQSSKPEKIKPLKKILSFWK